MKKKILFPVLLFTANMAFANNLQISGVAVNQTTQLVTFTLSWDNSWYVSSAPNNWDAVWVFVKWKACSDGPGVAYTHGVLSSTTSDHSYTNLQAMTSVNGVITESAPQGVTMDFTDGLMLRRSTVGLGSVSSSVSMKVTNLPSAGNNISFSVFAMEMVYVPQGNFQIGDGNGAAASNYSQLGSNLLNTTPMTVTSSFETGTQTFYLNNEPAGGSVQTITNVAAAFPKGQYGFYIMKYEISEDQYAQFLNTLTAVAAAARYPGNYATNRNQLNSTTTYATTRPDRAQNWLSWADVSAYLNWACLRPMTELEFEKSCRGISGANNLEYAWGNTTIAAGLSFAGAGVENGTETVTTGNCVYSNANFTNGDGGAAARAGIFATSSSNRQTAGATYYGVMDMTGNVREVVVALVGDAVANPTTGANNTFTRTWGDGVIDPGTGNHNTGGGWPLATVAAVANVTNPVGHKGGAWNNVIAQLTVSERFYIFWAPVITRQNYNGGRGVR